jgi:hypothetical protein
MAKPVERLFPFVLRSRILVVGRETLQRCQRKLQFVLITLDLSENSKSEILKNFADCPVIQRYSSEELEEFFGVKGAKVIGVKKSALGKSIYDELKMDQIIREKLS